MSAPARALSLSRADHEQVPRLLAFRAARPHVVIYTLWRGGAWQATFEAIRRGAAKGRGG